MATACVFCGASGTMTKEHVLPDWLERIGLTGQPAAAGSGWLNRSSEYRQTSRPFQTTVKAVCATCNNGWMSQLEQIAGRVLAPIIRGEATTVPDKDQPTLAMWALKTTLMAMRSSSQQDRDQGYGLPPTEFTDLPRQKDQLRPPDHVQVWLGHYSGQQHLASVQATPVIVTADPPAEPAHPHAYAFSVLVGQALLQGIRFTTPSLALDLTTEQGLTQIWPTRGDLEWPAGEPIPDLALPRVQKGLNLLPVGPGLHLLPFRPAVDLPRSTAEGQMVRLPTACGKHHVYYPDVLVTEARHRRFYAFATMCECPKAYLMQTEPDGAHLKAEGTPEAITERYEALPGEEIFLEDLNGIFTCKLIPSA